MYERTLEKELSEIVKFFPVVMVTGPRQVGKSTLLEYFQPEKYHRVTLDDLSERELAVKDPKMFLAVHKPPVLIDEVQYAPDLLSYIKIYVDTHPLEKGAFLLTGSQKFSLMKGLHESLAGRVAVLDLLGFSSAEIDKNPSQIPFLPTPEFIDSLRSRSLQEKTPEELYARIYLGSFPALISNGGKQRELFFRSYVQTYIERDVASAVSIRDSIGFKNFITAAAARTGQLLNINDLARDVGIDNATAKSWLGVLEMSGLIYLLRPYHNNLTKRLVRRPKLYFLDTGLCAYLTRWDTSEALRSGALNGAILETFALTEILKSFWHNALEAPIYYYRDHDQKEVDFVLESNGKIFPVEVKKTMMPSIHDAKHFNVLTKLGKPVAGGIVLSLAPKIHPLSRDVVSVPLWAI